MKSMELTPHQKMIIDALADDYENIGEISSAFPASVSKKQIEDALWFLIKQGVVRCFCPEKTEMKPVLDPQPHQLSEYWFDLSGA